MGSGVVMTMGSVPGRVRQGIWIKSPAGVGWHALVWGSRRPDIGEVVEVIRRDGRSQTRHVFKVVGKGEHEERVGWLCDVSSVKPLPMKSEQSPRITIDVVYLRVLLDIVAEHAPEPLAAEARKTLGAMKGRSRKAQAKAEAVNEDDDEDRGDLPDLASEYTAMEDLDEELDWCNYWHRIAELSGWG